MSRNGKRVERIIFIINIDFLSAGDNNSMWEMRERKREREREKKKCGSKKLISSNFK